MEVSCVYWDIIHDDALIREQKDAVMEKAKKETALADSSDFGINLAEFVVNRPDLFGTVEDEVLFCSYSFEQFQYQPISINWPILIYRWNQHTSQHQNNAKVNTTPLLIYNSFNFCKPSLPHP